MTSGDAWTTDNRLYEKMIRHFSEQDVMSVRGRQVVLASKENNPFEYYFVKERKEIIRKQFEPESFMELTPKEQYEACLIVDNVITMYRKSALEEQPFEGIAGEDIIWARNALVKGWKLVADLNAVVYHYHHYTFKKFCRRYKGAVYVYRYFNYWPKFSLIKDIGRIVYFLFVKPITKRRRFWLFYNLKISFCKWFCLTISKSCIFSRLCFYEK